MVAHDEILVRPQDRVRIGALIAKPGRHIRLCQRLSIHVDLAVVDAEIVSGNRNHPLDVTFRGVARVMKHDNIAAVDRLKMVLKLVDEEPFLVLQSRHHAGAFNTHRLVEERNNQEGDSYSKQQIAKPTGERKYAPLMVYILIVAAGQRIRIGRLQNRRYLIFYFITLLRCCGSELLRWSQSGQPLMSRFPVARALLLDAVRERAFPGAAYGVLLRGETIAIEAAGLFTYDQDVRPVAPETIFDIASVSKVLATTAMAMLLYERGHLDLDEPIAERLPEFAGNEPRNRRRRAVTARTLLAHSSGLPAYERLFERYSTAASLLRACLQMPLAADPGARTEYSDIGFIVLGHLLETLAGETIDAYCRREIFSPLAMNSTLYNPPADLRPSIPPTGIDRALRHRMLQGEVHDDNCWVLGGVAGHAGVFSDVADTLRFSACILRHGEPIFRPETVSIFTASQPKLDGGARALGWDMPSAPSSSGQFFSPHSVGHLGYTGTSLWMDLEKELAVVLLTNRTFPGDGPEGLSKKIRQVRPFFHDAILRELGFGSD